MASTLDLYMRDMARYALLDAEDEIALAEEVQHGKVAERRLAEGPVEDDQERRTLRINRTRFVFRYTWAANSRACVEPGES